ncbi:MAG: hypothetical protein PHT58_07400 [Eubacteriales bacterium]|nr:hypothetical protein [Eubacteriales bacterium]
MAGDAQYPYAELLLGSSMPTPTHTPTHTPKPTPFYQLGLILGDANRNREVDASDAAHILRWIVKIIPELVP